MESIILLCYASIRAAPIVNNMKKTLKFIWAYLKDWKNWLTHSIVGVLILLVAFYLPVEPIYRIVILALVVLFNILRMRVQKGKEKSPPQ